MWHYALLCRLVVFVIHFVILHLICQSGLKYFVLLDQMVLHIIFRNEKLRGRNFYFRFLTV